MTVVVTVCIAPLTVHHNKVVQVMIDLPEFSMAVALQIVAVRAEVVHLAVQVVVVPVVVAAVVEEVKQKTLFKRIEKPKRAHLFKHECALDITALNYA
jgi:hypothetical protein